MRLTKYHKIPKISPFLKGLFLKSFYSEGLMYGGKFPFQNRLASLQWEGNLPFLLCFTLYSRAISKCKPPGGLIFGGAI